MQFLLARIGKSAAIAQRDEIAAQDITAGVKDLHGCDNRSSFRILLKVTVRGSESVLHNCCGRYAASRQTIEWGMINEH
jgi:hypothetical protein